MTDRSNENVEAPKAEWMGESGYCNCLLVTMARIQIPELLLSTERDLPDLVALAADRADTQAWLKAPKLDLSALNKTTIIMTLAASAGIKPGDTSGTMNVWDVGEPGDPAVARYYHVLVGQDGEGVAVRISQTLKPRGIPVGAVGFFSAVITFISLLLWKFVPDPFSVLCALVAAFGSFASPLLCLAGVVEHGDKRLALIGLFISVISTASFCGALYWGVRFP